MHPILLPGSHVLRRGPGQLQVGLARPKAVTLAPGSVTPEALPQDAAALRTLRRTGLLVDDDAPLRAALPAHGIGDPWVRHTLSASVRRAADRPAQVLEERRRHEVAVTGFGHPVGRDLLADLESLCRRTGLPLRRRSRPGPPPRDAVPVQPLGVLVGVGEPSRDLLDGWLREAVPHLVVRLVEGRAVIGPFVVPGRTACLRCIDAYLAENDPAWPLLVEQYARACRADRADGIPEPVDAALAAVAVGWAVRDLESYAEGGRPSSWSTTTTLDAELSGITTRSWPTHPHCGCGWG